MENNSLLTVCNYTTSLKISIKSTSKFGSYSNNINPAFQKLLIHMALSEGSFWFSWHLWKSKIFYIKLPFVLWIERIFEICNLSWLQYQYYLSPFSKMFKHLLMENEQDWCPNLFLKKGTDSRHIKITKGGNYLFVKGHSLQGFAVCDLHLSLVCAVSGPEILFTENRTQWKRRVSGIFLGPLLTKIWEVVEAWAQTAFPWSTHRNSVARKIVVYLEWFRVWNPSYQRSQHYSTALT